MDKRKGNVGDLLSAAVCILAMTVVMLAYLNSVQLIQQKGAVGQLARRYILRMETVGCLTASDRTTLYQELEELGVTEIDLEGTTINAVPYGEAVALKIRGKLKGAYGFEETRVSTAKN